VHWLDPENALIGMQPDPAILRLIPDWEHRTKLGTASSPSTAVQLGDITITRRPKTNDFVYARIASVADGTTYERVLSLRLAPGPGLIGVYIKPDETEITLTNYVVPLPTLGRECIAGGHPERLVRQWSDEVKIEIKEHVQEKIKLLLADVVRTKDAVNLMLRVEFGSGFLPSQFRLIRFFSSSVCLFAMQYCYDFNSLCFSSRESMRAS